MHVTRPLHKHAHDLQYEMYLIRPLLPPDSWASAQRTPSALHGVLCMLLLRVVVFMPTVSTSGHGSRGTLHLLLRSQRRP